MYMCIFIVCSNVRQGKVYNKKLRVLLIANLVLKRKLGKNFDECSVSAYISNVRRYLKQTPKKLFGASLQDIAKDESIE